MIKDPSQNSNDRNLESRCFNDTATSLGPDTRVHLQMGLFIRTQTYAKQRSQFVISPPPLKNSKNGIGLKMSSHRSRAWQIMFSQAKGASGVMKQKCERYSFSECSRHAQLLFKAWGEMVSDTSVLYEETFNHSVNLIFTIIHCVQQTGSKGKGVWGKGNCIQ